MALLLQKKERLYGLVECDPGGRHRRGIGLNEVTKMFRTHTARMTEQFVRLHERLGALEQEVYRISNTVDLYLRPNSDPMPLAPLPSELGQPEWPFSTGEEDTSRRRGS